MVPAVGSDRAGTTGSAIPKNCAPGDVIRARVQFPQCWDGVNLDSPDHKSHMAYPSAFWTGDPYRQYRCPATHPVVLPQITFAVEFDVVADRQHQQMAPVFRQLRSGHAGGLLDARDWMNGWDPTISDLWGIKCMRERRNCGAANMGDGRPVEFQGN